MSDSKGNKKARILSGIQPSGILTIGQLTGAINNWVAMQQRHECYFMVVDMHAITVRQVPADLRKRTLDTIAMFIACGIDPEQSTLFIQSHVHEHAELTWVLNTFTGIGELSRMTQFKDKSQKNQENINVGLFSYPVLMASDILLYQADCVPVGADQKQHLELTRNIAGRFNHTYSDTFIIPEPYIPKVGAKIMSLQNPNKKMSKSDENENAIIYLNDTDEVIKRKIRRAVTDSGSEIKYDEENKAGVSNLMTLYSMATGNYFADIEDEFKGKSYGDFKPVVADAVADYIAPIRDKFEELRNDKKYLNEVMIDGAQKAQSIARKTLRKVYKKVGFYSV